MSNRHDIIEQNTGLLIALIILVVAVGGLVEIVPLYFQRCNWPAATSTSARAATIAIRR